ncbi:MAG: hypothetical protein AB8B55_04280 [Mariniblastus sp.]
MSTKFEFASDRNGPTYLSAPEAVAQWLAVLEDTSIHPSVFFIPLNRWGGLLD